MLYAFHLSANDMGGRWKGNIGSDDKPFFIIFNIEIHADSISGVADSPNQHKYGIPITSIIVEDKNVDIKITPFNLNFKGTFTSENTLEGNIVQNGKSLTCVFNKLDRPQEPRPPYNYESKNIVFKNEIENFYLAGTLTIPNKMNGFPAVVLISGSGLQNRDEEIFDHRPFRVIADYLSRRGIAVLRYDDRGYNWSKGRTDSTSMEGYMFDAMSAVNYLKTVPGLDTTRIGLIGHSEGGTIAFMAAARNPSISYIISMAGMGIPGDSLMLIQNRDILLAEGYSEEISSSYCALLQRVFDIYKTYTTEYILDNLQSLIQEVYTNNPLDLPDELKKNITLLLKTPVSYYLKDFLKHNPIYDLAQISCPVLAINGEVDLQVNSFLNLNAIYKGVHNNGNDKVTIIEYPNLNHLFQTAQTGRISEYGSITETISPQVLEDMYNWITQVVSTLQ